MSVNIRVEFLTNRELIDCLRKNNFPEDVISIIQEKGFNGKNLLALPEHQIHVMKLSSKELSTKLWKCIQELKTKPIQLTEQKRNTTMRTKSFNNKQYLVMNKLVEIHCSQPKTPSPVVGKKPSFLTDKPKISSKPIPNSRNELQRTESLPAPTNPEEDEEGYLNPKQINQNVPPANRRQTNKLNTKPANTLKKKKQAPLPPIPTDGKKTTKSQSPRSNNSDEEMNEYEEIVEPKVTNHNPITDRKPLAPPRGIIKSPSENDTAFRDSTDEESNKRLENLNRRQSSTIRKTDKAQGWFKTGSSHSFPQRILNRTHFHGRPLPPLPAPRSETASTVEKTPTNVQDDNKEIPKLPRKKGSLLMNELKKTESPESPEYVNTDLPINNTLREKKKSSKPKEEPVKTHNKSDLANYVNGVNKMEFTDADVQLRRPQPGTSKSLPKPPSHIDEYTTNKLCKLLTNEEEDQDERQEEDAEEDEYVEYENLEYNLNDEPFYRNTDSRGAQMLLQRYDTGAFLVRPSKSRFYLSLSIKHDDTFKHVGIIRQNGRFRLDSKDNTGPDFICLRDLLNFFQKEPVVLSNNLSIVLKPYLPTNVF